MNQNGFAARSAVIISLLIAGVIAMYLHMKQAESLAPPGGTGDAFVAHDGPVLAEMRGAGIQNVTFTETAENGTTVISAPDATECNEVKSAQAAQICASHRVQYHRDSHCTVRYDFNGGSCGK